MNAFFRKLFQVFIVMAVTVLMVFTVPAEAAKQPVTKIGIVDLYEFLAQYYPVGYHEGESLGYHPSEGVSQGKVFIQVFADGHYRGHGYYRRKGSNCYEMFEGEGQLYMANAKTKRLFYAYGPGGELHIDVFVKSKTEVIATASIGPGTENIFEHDEFVLVDRKSFMADEESTAMWTCDSLRSAGYAWPTPALDDTIATAMSARSASAYSAEGAPKPARSHGLWGFTKLEGNVEPTVKFDLLKSPE